MRLTAAVNEWLRTRLDRMPKRVYVRCVGGAEVVIGANAEHATARNQSPQHAPGIHVINKVSKTGENVAEARTPCPVFFHDQASKQASITLSYSVGYRGIRLRLFRYLPGYLCCFDLGFD